MTAELDLEPEAGHIVEVGHLKQEDRTIRKLGHIVGVIHVEQKIEEMTYMTS